LQGDIVIQVDADLFPAVELEAEIPFHVRHIPSQGAPLTKIVIPTKYVGTGPFPRRRGGRGICILTGLILGGELVLLC